MRTSGHDLVVVKLLGMWWPETDLVSATYSISSLGICPIDSAGQLVKLNY